MKRTVALAFLTALMVVVFATIATSAQAGTAPALVRFDEAVDELMLNGWPKTKEKALVAFSTEPLPFRIAGSSSDIAAAKWVASQMRLMGLANVRLEGVPVDAWTFSKASVVAGAVTMKASSFAGQRGTPLGGITGEVVYVGGGTAADFDAAGDVAGKIALVDCMFASWWMSTPAMEAEHRGCAAVIFTYTPDDPTMYSIAPDALGSYDWPASPSTPPAVYVSATDGAWLKSQVETAPTTVTVRSNARLKLMENGGTTYNTVGVIPGRDTTAPRVVVAAHRDGYFKAASDNGAGVVTTLLLAKAIKKAGIVPKRTIVFIVTGAEEYGWTDCYSDYLIGSWWSITQTHPTWPGKIAAMINNDFGAVKGGWMTAAADSTLQGYAQAIADAEPAVSTVNGTALTVEGENKSWTDVQPFALAGVPTLDMECLIPDDSPYSGFVHTDKDTLRLIDYNLMGNAAKYEFRVIKGLGGGVLPHALSARAESLCAGVDVTALEGAGIDSARVDRLAAALEEFERVTTLYDENKAVVPLELAPSTNRRVLAIVSAFNQEFLALDPYGFFLYLHAQTLSEVQHMQSAIAALDEGDGDTAYWELVSVGHTWTGMNFSQAVFADFLRMQRPTYDRLTWAGMGDTAIYQNLKPELAMIEDGDLTGAKASVEAKLAVQMHDLDGRVDTMAATLEELSFSVLDLVPLNAAPGR